MIRFVVLLAVLAGSAAARQTLPGPYQAEVTRVIDGDSFEARVTIWLGQEAVTIVRLAGIDAAELDAPCARVRLEGVLARAVLAARIEGRQVTLTGVSADKYGGRILARAADEAGRDLGGFLADAGLARPYQGGRRADGCAS